MNKPDHRSRVGAERRERMRKQLINSALILFAQRGLEEVVIDDVIAAAGVSRGTFYNYFKTNSELLAAVSEELGNELVNLIEGAVSTLDDPAERMALGLRLYLHAATVYPVFANFIARTGMNAMRPTNMVFEYIPHHLDQGIKGGRFKVSSVDLAVDIVLGISLAAVSSIASKKAPPGYPKQVTRHILLGLGMFIEEVEALLIKPLPRIKLPTESLLAQTDRTPGDETDIAVA